MNLTVTTLLLLSRWSLAYSPLWRPSILSHQNNHQKPISVENNGKNIDKTNSNSVEDDTGLIINPEQITGNSDGNNDETIKSTAQVYTLDSVRATLIRQEETIIFSLIERAAFCRNDCIYDPKVGNYRNIYRAPLSFMEYMLLETEKLHAKVRRYTSPEEHPFFPNLLPQPILRELDYPELLRSKKEVNINNELFRWYVEKILTKLCKKGDDEQHGSTVLCDISCLQALSRRVHYGQFVAESKFQENPTMYSRYVKDRDCASILRALTDAEVERRVIRRSYMKASTYGQDITGLTEGYKVDPMLIADIYRDLIIPLTKDVEVRYLFLRMGVEPPPPDDYFHLCAAPKDSFEDPDFGKQFVVPVPVPILKK